MPVQVEDKVSRPRPRISDYAASGYAALALAVAVMSARLNGRGQHLDVSIHDAIMSWTAHGAWAAREHAAQPHESPTVMPDNDLFETHDGRHLALGILENKFWLHLRDALGQEFPALLDERFASRAGRQRCKKEVNALLKAVFHTRSLADWERAFEALDLPFSPVLGAWELFADPSCDGPQHGPGDARGGGDRAALPGQVFPRLAGQRGRCSVPRRTGA